MKRAKYKYPAALFALVAGLGIFAGSAAARVDSELAPPERRHEAVEKAVHVSKLVRVDALSPDLPNPFAPPQFSLSDAEEAAAAAAAARQPGQSSVVAPPTDRELLAAIAAKIVPSGTIYLGGRPLLMFGKRFVRTGSRFTVTYKGADYVLELTDIDGTNFTLRYNKEEITKPVKSPPAKAP
jgi:hypothetical protein